MKRNYEQPRLDAAMITKADVIVMSAEFQDSELGDNGVFFPGNEL